MLRDRNPYSVVAFVALVTAVLAGASDDAVGTLFVLLVLSWFAD